MDNRKLTKRQAQVLELIERKTKENGYPPSVREIGEELGLTSSATVHAHLEALEAKGYLHREGSKSRSLTIASDSKTVEPEQFADAATNIVTLPLVGRVAAGAPILAEQNIEANIPLPKEIIGDSSSFLLRVKGDSMVNAGIFSGDYVVVREQQTAQSGEIVVAMIDDSATVKTFYREKDRIRLQPENDSMAPIYASDVKILGRVVALFRTI